MLYEIINNELDSVDWTIQIEDEDLDELFEGVIEDNIK